MPKGKATKSSNNGTMTPSPSFDLKSADRPFDNIINFRDVGRTINKFHGSNIIQEGVLFRAARPDDGSERDKQRLVDDLGVSTLLDLRSNTEHLLATKRRRSALSLETSDTAVIVDADEHLLQLPGVQRHMISLPGRAFERSLLWRLDWYNFFKVLGLMASGYRYDATRIVATTVMKPRGLIGLGQDLLDCSADELREIFNVLAEDSSYPIIIHCTQGKDRTGLVILMLLLLTDVVPLDAIASDYTKSEAELEPELDFMMKEITDVGLDEDYAKCPPGFTEAMRSYLDEKYGGVREYLLAIGVSEDKIDRIRKRLLI